MDLKILITYKVQSRSVKINHKLIILKYNYIIVSVRKLLIL
jgi:hypothetical protein